MMTANLAWHYTIGDYFHEIVGSGLLKTTSAGVPVYERPVLWFSMNQLWEPTARKAVIENGEYRSLSMQETKEKYGGLARFGYPQSRLIPWIHLWKHAGILPTHKRTLEKVGKEQGANPFHWLGCFEGIPVDELFVEFMNESGEWIPALLQEAA